MPATNDASDFEDLPVKQWVHGLADRAAAELTSKQRLTRAIQQINSGDVLYYPACWNDWAAIRNLSDRCRVFLFCDWRMTLEQFEHEMLQLPFQSPARNAFRCDARNAQAITAGDLLRGAALPDPGLLARFLTLEEVQAYRSGYETFANKLAWGRYVPTIHSVEGEDRHLDLLYLCAEGVSAYLQVFGSRQAAPKYLCVRNPGAGYGCGWTDFRDWSAPLGRAVAENLGTCQQPEYLVAEYQNWPWTVPALEFTDWGRIWGRALE
jgi:hypothetical protein